MKNADRLHRIIRWYVRDSMPRRVYTCESAERVLLVQARRGVKRDLEQARKWSAAWKFSAKGWRWKSAVQAQSLLDMRDTLASSTTEKDERIVELGCQLVERLQLATRCADEMFESCRERDTFRDRALALEEQLTQCPVGEDTDCGRAYYAEIERDAAFSDVKARDERIRVLERLLRRWLEYPGPTRLRKLDRDTREQVSD